jgi:hypothetical protein
MEFLKSALSSLPTVATSPLALVGYLAVIAAWVVIALKVQRNRQLLENLKNLPAKDRLQALRDEMGTIPLKEGLSPEQFIKLRTRRYRSLAISIPVCLVILMVGWCFTPWASIRARPDVYRLRVTVIDPVGTPVDGAKVWSSIGGEQKTVPGGWEIDIPSGIKPADGRLTVYASKESAFLKGQEDLRLADDYNPAVKIKLQKDKSAGVRGVVRDASNRAVAGARVNVVGYEREAVTTSADGGFALPAHWAPGEQVDLHVEGKGIKPVDQGHPAGDEPATIIVDRK